MSAFTSLFTEVNLLVFLPLILLLLVWFILGMAQPICVFIDCLDSDLGWKKKLFWLSAMIFSLGLASFIYPWLNPTGRIMRVADRVMLSPLVVLLGIYLTLYCFHDGVRDFFNLQILGIARWIGHFISVT